MAIHTELDIHKAAYDLFDVIVDLVKNMPRDFKALIGAELRKECIAILVLIFRANCARDKESYLLQVVERVQVAELMIRLARDKHMISTGQYAAAIKITTSIGRQANGWRKHSNSSAS
jgi:translation initiation factor RLI1